MATVKDALRAAVEHHRSGEFEQAGSLYEQVLRANPNHPDALQLVGVMSQQMGRPYEAIQFIKRAINVVPHAPEYHNNLAAAWLDASNPTEAARACRRAIQLRPSYAEAHANLAAALHALGDLPAAEEKCRRAVKLAPGHANAWFNLGNIQRDRDEPDDAATSYREAIRIRPSHIQALNNLGQLLLSCGQFDEARDIYCEARQFAPDEPVILKTLATIEAGQGRGDAAIVLYSHALRSAPSDTGIMNLLGLSLHELRRYAEAADILQQAIRVEPDAPDAHNNLGMVRAAQGQSRLAVACYEKALKANPDAVETLCNLGVVLRNLGENAQARNCLSRAVGLAPDCVEAHNNLGTVYQASGEHEAALESYRTALRLRPEYPDGLCNLASLHHHCARPAEAEKLYRQALDLAPDSVDTLNNLGNLMREQGRLRESEQLLEAAVLLRDSDSDLLNNLASVLKDEGRVDEAITAFDQALAINPGFTEVISNRLTCHQYLPDISLRTLAEEHAIYDAVVAEPLRSARQPLTNDRDPDRPLRVGFVSSDFGCHPVGMLLVRGFEALNREHFITACYSNRRLDDELTARLRATASLWRDVSYFSDEQLARQIQTDGIDILVDLAGHTAGNRLLVFARKPAPVQVTWLGYVGSTGLTAMDYLLTDRYHVPASAERFYVEQIVRLPESHVVFDPPADSPDVGPLPMLVQGAATFASFNNPAKISPQVVDLWSSILKQNCDSRIILKYRGFDDPANADRYSGLFQAASIESTRLELQGSSPQRDMLNEYNRVDVTLDPFPFTGGMTTLLSLWMGVPVITVAGETFASRQSMSFLTQLGLTELIADDKADYVDRATELVRDAQRLAGLRSTLRQRLLDSPLCNSDCFARSLESAFREMWRKWCGSAS